MKSARESRDGLQPLELPALSAQPLVSVLMPNYNYGEFIGEAIESVLQQTYSYFELIVCDDGSSDNSRDVVERYQARDSRIKLLPQDNAGQGAAIYRAYAESKGELIFLLDADDLYLPEKLAIVVAAHLESPNAGLAIHKMQVIDGNHRKVGLIPAVSALPSGWHGPRISLTAPTFLPGFSPSSGISMHGAVAKEILPLLAGKRVYSDTMIQSVAPLITPILALDQVLAEYRVHGNNTSSTFTADRIRTIVATETEVWTSWRAYLISISERLPPDFVIPPEKPALMMRYALARIENDPAFKDFHRRAFEDGCYQSMPTRYKLYWKFSIVLPRWAFRPSLNTVFGHGYLKTILARTKYTLQDITGVLRSMLQNHFTRRWREFMRERERKRHRHGPCYEYGQQAASVREADSPEISRSKD
jgi:glycosyltransferase involved in cell wall biosynthesis